ncbi:MAG TPA: helix-turn-helix domain-containing protein [Acidimicrobiia bacterium]|nr:helix-turn-helix domain-containing protein [Acidimicrobiia bacterium]
MAESSALAAALARVGDRWKLLIIDALLVGPARYSDLEQAIEGISTNILSARLKELERQGLVLAEPYSDRPPRFEYSLTAPGKELAGALRMLADWGAHHGDGATPPRHELCGTSLEVRWYCPTCGVTTQEADAFWLV